MIILGIETSCDDTCIGIIKASEKKKSKVKILANIISSQVKLHRRYGGVYPLLARREHKKNLPRILKRALGKAKNSHPDLIAVTQGPGLEPCLWIGVNFASQLAEKLDSSLVAVNHLEAHIYSSFIKKDFDFDEVFPAVCLIVSGGHTQLVLIRSFGRYRLLGETRDDAAGECFDKTARTLGLSYPGGPAIEQEAAKIKARKRTKKRLELSFPRPMMNQKNFDFSFSGLKTAVLYDYRSRTPKVRKSKEYVRAAAREIQQAVIDVLIHKTLRAAEDFAVKSIILGGGVTANHELRRQFKRRQKKELPAVRLIMPDPALSTDNALMTAVTAYYHWLKKKKPSAKNLKAEANLRLGR
jgi:N6-L-threonylcarbamoyladenine synthase